MGTKQPIPLPKAKRVVADLAEVQRRFADALESATKACEEFARAVERERNNESA